MDREPTARVRTVRVLARFLGACTVVAMVAVVYLQVAGLPGWAADQLLERVSTPNFAVEAGSIRLGIRTGLRADSVRVYRKGAVGPAALTAERVEILVQPVSVVFGSSCVWTVRIEGGVLDWKRASPGPPARDPFPPAVSGRDVSLDMEWRRCRIGGVDIERLDSRVHVRDADWHVRVTDATLARDGMQGSWSGAAMYDGLRRSVKGKLVARFDPTILLPWFDAWDMGVAARLVREFRFGEAAPLIEAEFLRDLAPETNAFETDAKVWSENSAFRGVDVERGDADVTIRIDGDRFFLSIDPLNVTRSEGRCRAGFEYDNERGDVRFHGDSSVDPKAILRMIGILTKGELDPFDVEGPFRAKGQGLVALRNRVESDFRVEMECGGIRWGDLRAEACAFELLMEGTTNRIENFRGTLNQGKLQGSIAFFFDPISFTNTGYKAVVSIADAAGASFRRTAVGAQGSGLEGTLAGSLMVSGPPGSDAWAAGMTGSGSIRIRDGRVFSLPLFGGFSQIMTRVIPGLDLVLRQTDADASFTISDGKIHSDEIRIQGDVLSLLGSGDYYCADGKLDLSVRVTLMRDHTLVAKLVAPLLYPISKLFELRLRGTLDAPEWYPVNFSREMLQRLGLAAPDERTD